MIARMKGRGSFYGWGPSSHQGMQARTAVRARLGALLYTGVRKTVTVEWTG